MARNSNVKHSRFVKIVTKKFRYMFIMRKTMMSMNKIISDSQIISAIYTWRRLLCLIGTCSKCLDQFLKLFMIRSPNESCDLDPLKKCDNQLLPLILIAIINRSVTLLCLKRATITPLFKIYLS